MGTHLFDSTTAVFAALGTAVPGPGDFGPVRRLLQALCPGRSRSETEDMAQWTTFLDRFRPAGAPGAAGPRGVPADRRADAAAELAPLLPLLDDIESEADRIRTDARDRADQLRRDAARQAACTVQTARAGAGEVAARAAFEVQAAAAADETAAEAAHAAELAAVRTAAAARMPDYLNRAAAQLHTLLAEAARG